MPIIFFSMAICDRRKSDFSLSFPKPCKHFAGACTSLYTFDNSEVLIGESNWRIVTFLTDPKLFRSYNITDKWSVIA